MKRRQVLASVPPSVSLVSGCIAGAGERNSPAHSGVATTPCQHAFTPHERTSDDCGVSFDYVDTEPVSEETTGSGETPYEGTYHDYLELILSGDSSRTFELRGCIDGTLDNEEKTLEVVESFELSDGSRQFQFGPFTHPGGISKHHLWIVGCDAEVRGKL